jgi:DNA-directed RNA polymerase subunit RPC12/RpoP
MMFDDEYAASLLKSGIIEAKAGEINLARNYLDRAIYAASDHDLRAEAWYWMSTTTQKAGEKRKMLENALANDLMHARARRALAVLDGKLKQDEIVNPDALPPAPDHLTSVDAERFVCPKCGGRMVYAPDGHSLVCEYCTRREALGTKPSQAEEQDFYVAMATARGHRKPVAVQVFHCHGCGSEFVLPPDVMSATCAYCNSPHVVKLDETRELIEPEGIIPHAFSQHRAAEILVAWVENHKIPPQDKVEIPRGLYVPVWTFDIGGGIDYSGDMVEQERQFGQRANQVRHVADRYAVSVDDLPVPASRKLARSLESLLPTYRLEALQAYDARYLADWMAEVYDIPMADASLDARSRAYQRYKPIIAADLAPITNLRMSSANLAIESFKLVLLPLWTTTFRYDGQEIPLLINGQTSAVQGRVPHGETRKFLGWLEDLLGIEDQ